MRSAQLANEDLSGGGREGKREILLSAAVFSCSTPHDRTFTRREGGDGNHSDSLFVESTEMMRHVDSIF